MSMTTDVLEQHLAAMSETRARTYALVDGIAEDDLVRVHSPLMSPLVWDLGHIAAFEDLWLVHRFGERPMVREELATVYDAFETPRAARGDLPFLGPREARGYLEEVREQATALARDRGIGEGTPHEMVLRHEHQHCETMLQTIQLAHLDPFPDEPEARRGAASPRVTGLKLTEVPAGPCAIGAPPDGFAYDNERPQHEAWVDDVSIGTTPVTNGAYLEFVHAGGYQRREWWSREGWEWRAQHAIEHPGGWTDDLEREWRLGALSPIEPSHPVVHVSWYEADAFTRAHGARLPTEFEWEKAAAWDPAAGETRAYPWGEAPPSPGAHGNLDQRERGPVSAGTHPGGDSAYGVGDMIGQVWEWTASTFGGYAGFVAHPYREYSEVFFGQRHRVLRGGSWATRARVASPTFRNWDFPERRQIFAGLRIAK